MTQKKMLLVFNPKAGTQKFKSNLFAAVELFTAAGFLVTAYPTRGGGEAGSVVGEYAASYDAVVCAGGDGTIREVIDALLRHEKRPPFGMIPSGSANDLAASLGIPKSIMKAAATVIRGEAKMLDIGRFGDRHFAYMAAFGLFTDVAYTTPQNIKNMFGYFAYLLEGVKRLGSVSAYPCVITLDGETIEGEFVLGLVSNARSVGGIKLPEKINIQMDDGLFEVILMRKPTGIKDLQRIIAALNNQEIDEELFTVRKAGKVGFVSKEPVAWTLDGDFGGEVREISIENLCRAVEVMVPPAIITD
jgi:YegS/Rv2252/BmrU family lipid kinase